MKLCHHILLLEDDPRFGSSFAAWLGNYAESVQWCQSIASAMAHLQSTKCDAVFADIYLGTTRSILPIEHLLNQAAVQPPLFLITGRPCVQTACEAVGLSIAGYLTKPLDLARTAHLLEHHVRRLQRRREEAEHLVRCHTFLSSAADDPAIDQAMRAELREVAAAIPLPPASQPSDRYTQTLREAIAVLESTRSQFKSQTLAQLRTKLQAVVETMEHGTRTPPSDPLKKAQSPLRPSDL
jgi:DNA-binding NtrC family response regulator